METPNYPNDYTHRAPKNVIIFESDSEQSDEQYSDDEKTLQIAFPMYKDLDGVCIDDEENDPLKFFERMHWETKDLELEMNEDALFQYFMNKAQGDDSNEYDETQSYETIANIVDDRSDWETQALAYFKHCRLNVVYEDDTNELNKVSNGTQARKALVTVNPGCAMKTNLSPKTVALLLDAIAKRFCPESTLDFDADGNFITTASIYKPHTITNASEDHDEDSQLDLHQAAPHTQLMWWMQWAFVLLVQLDLLSATREDVASNLQKIKLCVSTFLTQIKHHRRQATDEHTPKRLVWAGCVLTDRDVNHAFCDGNAESIKVILQQFFKQ